MQKQCVTDLNPSAKRRDYNSNKNSILCVESHDFILLAHSYTRLLSVYSSLLFAFLVNIFIRLY